MSNAITEGIRVSVKTRYLAERSTPTQGQYFFAYTVTIANEGDEPAQLRTRHWIITDGDGGVEEVRGPGVVGEQPTLRPGQSFEYTSFCVLKTPYGQMRGTYQMVTPAGRDFDAVIAPFKLVLPQAWN